MAKQPLIISVTQAAKLMRHSTLFVREGLKRGELEIGTALKMPGSTRYTYSIDPQQLAKRLAIDIDSLRKLIEEMEESA